MKEITLRGYGTRHSSGIRHKIPGFIITAVLVILALAVILPLVLPFFFVFKTQLEYAYNPWSLPKQIRWLNFQEAWTAIQIGQGLLNTVCRLPGRGPLHRADGGHGGLRFRPLPEQDHGDRLLRHPGRLVRAGADGSHPALPADLRDRPL